MDSTLQTNEWAQTLIDEQVNSVQQALDAYCCKPAAPKRVHRVRKALARLQSTLRDLASLTPAAGALRKEARLLYRRAGRVRDADVLLDRLRTYRGAAPRKDADAIESLCLELGKRRRKASRRFRKAVARSAFARAS